ncbi:MAG: metallophosphoesterase family protein [Actinobacteria bacterium]|nr:MAG: metallophosphoesterase family protein [Actinomycetota bacterium]
MRVAALYDIHGNLPALDAVLAEVDADVILVGGDFVAGPWPAETYERLTSLEGDVRFIRGNADREVVEEEPGRAPPELMDFVRGRLSDDAFSFLRSLPLTETIDRVLFCHATPRDDEEIFTRVSPEESWREALDGVDADIVVCGHTHIQFDRPIGDIRVVNAGSVGMPYEREAGAYWALLDGNDVELRRTEYVPGDLSVWPGEWPEASPEEATEFFEKLSREQ